MKKLTGLMTIVFAVLTGCATPGYEQECAKFEETEKREECIADYYDRTEDESGRDIAAQKGRSSRARAAAAASINARNPVRLQPKHVGEGDK